MTDIHSKEVFLKDYQPSAYLIKVINLEVDLYENYALVISTLHIGKNPLNQQQTTTLILNGEEQELLSISLNGEQLETNQYKQTANSLNIYNLSVDNFSLLIKTKIKPQENTHLSGLFKSGNIFCTQCESQGFRRITYYLDRPDIMAKFTCKITADKAKYPVLLSNGNLIEHGDVDTFRHFVLWQDPFAKPCYLFALVAGDLIAVEDHFLTKSSRLVTLKIYVEHINLTKTQHAMQALKKAMAWDEEVYGREYDLDIYMIVAVNDFNMGAMESKGLNIFNSKYVLADPQTATDQDFEHIDAVIAHEYFHNWSGNRVTCRDWFQLSLKEGFTVFRDQQFSEYLSQSASTRIEQVKVLTTKQFAEDAGSMAHPVRPESYQEIDNFYTVTVYEKGAEVIRMLHTILGVDLFRQGTDLYFKRHDGEAVTIEDFVKCLEDVSGIDLTQFRLWYSTAGTPEIAVTEEYNDLTKEYAIKFVQKSSTAMHIPIRMALLDANGNNNSEVILQLKELEQRFVFSDMLQQPVPSLLRDFSAPIKLQTNLSDDKLMFILEHDNNEFNRWDAGQKLMRSQMLLAVTEYASSGKLIVPDKILGLIKCILENNKINDYIKALLLKLPSLEEIITITTFAEPDIIYQVRRNIVEQIGVKFRDLLQGIYQQLITTDRYSYTMGEVGKRTLKNVVLSYLLHMQNAQALHLAEQQYNTADNMTDVMAVLQAITHLDISLKGKLFDSFYTKWQHEPLVVNKWLQVQAISESDDTLVKVRELLVHKSFRISNPNNVYALIGGFCGGNLLHFHAKDGSGYKFLTEQILALDAINPQVAARMLVPFTKLANYALARQSMIRENLQQLAEYKQLSKNTAEIVHKSLG